MKKLTILLLILGAFGCSDQKIDTVKARQEVLKHEIQVVSDADILETAMEMGNEISSKILYKPSQADSSGIYFENAALDSLRKSFVLFGQPNRLKGKSLEIFEAYVYNLENDIEYENNVQFSEAKKTIIYTSPLPNGRGILLFEIPRKDVVLSLAK